MLLDLSNPAIRDSFDAMLEAAAGALTPQELVRWHHRIEGCQSLAQAAEVTTEMIGRPMSESDRRIAEEVRQLLSLQGDSSSKTPRKPAVWTAELRYASTNELVGTGSSNGKSPPNYSWADEVEPERRIGMEIEMAEFYREGLYGTGSPGQVRDMVHAMQRLSDAYKGWLVVAVPETTQRQIDAEIARDQAERPEGAVW